MHCKLRSKENDSELLARMRRLIDEQTLAIENEAWDLALWVEKEKRIILEEALKSEGSQGLLDKLSEELFLMKVKVEQELSSLRSKIFQIKKTNLPLSRQNMGRYLSASA